MLDFRFGLYRWSVFVAHFITLAIIEKSEFSSNRVGFAFKRMVDINFDIISVFVGRLKLFWTNLMGNLGILPIVDQMLFFLGLDFVLKTVVFQLQLTGTGFSVKLSIVFVFTIKCGFLDGPHNLWQNRHFSSSDYNISYIIL